MNCVLFLANGFEDHEALTTRDILIRSGINVTTVSITNDKLVKTSHNVLVYADEVLENVDFDIFDGMIIPGGYNGVFQGLDKVLQMKDIIKSFDQRGKLICAICAGPHILGKYGFLESKSYTSFPGCNKDVIGGNYLNQGVVQDENYITGKSMYYTIDFALEIVKYLLGNDKKIEMLNKIKGE